jgi:hypothetical protein
MQPRSASVFVVAVVMFMAIVLVLMLVLVLVLTLMLVAAFVLDVDRTRRGRPFAPKAPHAEGREYTQRYAAHAATLARLSARYDRNRSTRRRSATRARPPKTGGCAGWPAPP